jgi:hypothetical protein
VIAAVLTQEAAELDQAVFTLAGGDEDHRLLLAVQVDEDGDVVVLSFVGGFVKSIIKCRHTAIQFNITR